nr:hypothetical protein [uncultured Rhodopila sp.]
MLTMRGDLHMIATDFSFAVGTFYRGYFLFEVPGNIIPDKAGARSESYEELRDKSQEIFSAVFKPPRSLRTERRIRQRRRRQWRACAARSADTAGEPGTVRGVESCANAKRAAEALCKYARRREIFFRTITRPGHDSTPRSARSDDSASS